MAKKIEKHKHEPRECPVIVFGSQRIGAIYALRHGISPSRIRLATSGGKSTRDVSDRVLVVRVSEDAWQPPTHACERRTKETEQALKALEASGTTIENALLA